MYIHAIRNALSEPCHVTITAVCPCIVLKCPKHAYHSNDNHAHYYMHTVYVHMSHIHYCMLSHLHQLLPSPVSFPSVCIRFPLCFICQVPRIQGGLSGGGCDIAFVEFELDRQATDAKNALQGFKVTPQHAMHLTCSSCWSSNSRILCCSVSH